MGLDAKIRTVPKRYAEAIQVSSRRIAVNALLRTLRFSICDQPPHMNYTTVFYDYWSRNSLYNRLCDLSSDNLQMKRRNHTPR
jgi:hypothetical protein